MTTETKARVELERCKNCGIEEGDGRDDKIVDGTCISCLVELHPPAPGPAALAAPLPGPMDLVELERYVRAVGGEWASMLLTSTALELLRRARQLEAVEAFLRQYGDDARRGLLLTTVGGDGADTLSDLLRSLAIPTTKGDR